MNRYGDRVTCPLCNMRFTWRSYLHRRRHEVRHDVNAYVEPFTLHHGRQWRMYHTANAWRVLNTACRDAAAQHRFGAMYGRLPNYVKAILGDYYRATEQRKKGRLPR